MSDPINKMSDPKERNDNLNLPESNNNSESIRVSLKNL
jgi:hypothetical protein